MIFLGWRADYRNRQFENEFKSGYTISVQEFFLGVFAKILDINILTKISKNSPRYAQRRTVGATLRFAQGGGSGIDFRFLDARFRVREPLSD